MVVVVAAVANSSRALQGWGPTREQAQARSQEQGAQASRKRQHHRWLREQPLEPSATAAAHADTLARRRSAPSTSCTTSMRMPRESFTKRHSLPGGSAGSSTCAGEAAAAGTALSCCWEGDHVVCCGQSDFSCSPFFAMVNSSSHIRTRRTAPEDGIDCSASAATSTCGRASAPRLCSCKTVNAIIFPWLRLPSKPS